MTADAIESAPLTAARKTIVGLEGDESVWIGRRFATWEKQLPAEIFLRVSRRLLVNLTHVVRLEAVTKESAQLFLDGRSLPIELSRLEAARVTRRSSNSSPPTASPAAAGGGLPHASRRWAWTGPGPEKAVICYV